jgi:hypothetical protein
MEPQKQKPELLREKPSYIAVREHKPTDDVPLKLVSPKEYRRRTLFRMEYPDTWPKFFQIFFYPDPLTIQNSFTLRLIATIVVAVFTVQIIVQGYDAWIFQGMHHLNLLIHEAGHTIFMPAAWLGHEQVMTFMGSGLQVLLPLGIGVVYWVQNREIMGTAISLWWTLENLVDVAIYVGDAKVMQLMLTSGSTGSENGYGGHDWNYLLTEWGHLQDCLAIEHALNMVAKVGMVFCILWTLWSLFYYWVYQRNKPVI